MSGQQVAHKRRLRAEDQAKLVKEILISGNSRRPSASGSHNDVKTVEADGKNDGKEDFNFISGDPGANRFGNRFICTECDQIWQNSTTLYLRFIWFWGKFQLTLAQFVCYWAYFYR